MLASTIVIHDNYVLNVMLNHYFSKPKIKPNQFIHSFINVCTLIGLLSSQTLLAQSSDALNISMGKHLSMACVSCHSSPDLPNLKAYGQPLLESRLLAYSASKVNPQDPHNMVMHQLSKGYNELEIKAIAGYLASHESKTATNLEAIIDMPKLSVNHSLLSAKQKAQLIKPKAPANHKPIK